jgi:alkanesulfonate monooxygenase SsuD/methylene tetrahydromethanopterin reductase-like flavin-dependent oxidoreductase (luciferase family)
MYQERFQPSDSFPQPQANVGVGVICAPTAEEAEHLALSMQLWRMRIMHGRDRGIPSPEEAEREFAGMGVQAAMFRDDLRSVVGTPDHCRTELLRLAEHYGVEEILVVTVTHDFAARLRSYELLAGALELKSRSFTARGATKS